MTEQIGNHGLFCIGDEDYAAYALAMKCNAEAIDSSLQASNASLEAYLSRPWQEQTTSASVTVFDDQSGGSIGPFGIVGSTIGNGTPVTVSNGLPTGTFFPPGIYLIGAAINWTLVTPTANSYRQLSVFGVATINGETNISTTFVNWYGNRDYQGDGGNNGALNVWGVMDNREGNVGSIMSFFSHGNTAGTLTVPAQGWRMWVTYLGSGLNF